MDCVLGNQNERTVKITKVVQLENARRIAIDVNKLKEVLKNPKYADYPVAIYTVTGPFNTGKSFLLNLWIPFINRFMVKTPFYYCVY